MRLEAKEVDLHLLQILLWKTKSNHRAYNLKEPGSDEVRVEAPPGMGDGGSDLKIISDFGGFLRL